MVVSVLAATTAAQRRGFFGWGRNYVRPNAPYDGRFNVVRIRYQGCGRWSADYPTMERHLSVMLNEITSMSSNTEESNVYTFDDPELMKYPVAYLTEPGCWYPDPAEVEGLRTYLAKGGFLVVDDFHFDNEWYVFESAIHTVLPGVDIVRLDVSHPIFNTFFSIKTLEIPYPGGLGEQGLMGEFFGMYVDNDRSKPLNVVINYNMDIGDYMEWSDQQGLYEFASTNEAYKLAINYITYGLTH